MSPSKLQTNSTFTPLSTSEGRFFLQPRVDALEHAKSTKAFPTHFPLFRLTGRYQDALHLERTSFESADELTELFQVRARLWRALDNWDIAYQKWYNSPFSSLDVEGILDQLKVSGQLFSNALATTI